MTNLYRASVPQLTKMLRNLDAWLEKASAHAAARSASPDALLQSRLVFDQFALVKQVQAACDAAKFAAARVADKEAPKHEDTETTMEEVRARIGKVLAYLEGFSPADFEGAEGRLVSLGFLPPGKKLRAEEYLIGMALPNFYFHVTTAYAILRSNGVALGKYDYIGGLELVDA